MYLYNRTLSLSVLVQYILSNHRYARFQTKKQKYKLFSFVFGKDTTVREEKEDLLKEELRVLAIRTRNRLNITQKKMAKVLEMSESSYSDIETGKSMCGTLTAILLLDMQEDPSGFLQDLRTKFSKQYEERMQPV